MSAPHRGFAFCGAVLKSTLVRLGVSSNCQSPAMGRQWAGELSRVVEHTKQSSVALWHACHMAEFATAVSHTAVHGGLCKPPTSVQHTSGKEGCLFVVGKQPDDTEKA